MTEWTERRIRANDLWNINEFSEKLSILNVNPVHDRIPGVHRSFVIVEMDETWFSAHKEDSDLASINILLGGAPKIWYICHPEKLKIYFKMSRGVLSMNVAPSCDINASLFPPWLLAQHGIKFCLSEVFLEFIQKQYYANQRVGKLQMVIK